MRNKIVLNHTMHIPLNLSCGGKDGQKHVLVPYIRNDCVLLIFARLKERISFIVRWLEAHNLYLVQVSNGSSHSRHCVVYLLDVHWMFDGHISLIAVYGGHDS